MENWKDIKGFTGYQVSDKGRVRSWKNGNGRWGRADEPLVLKHNISTTGYPYAILYKNKKAYTKKIHRLVAKTFIENPKNKRTVNHKDGDKLNPEASNLEWCTYAENHKHAVENGLIIDRSGEGNEQSKLTANEVLDIRNAYKLGCFTQTEIAKAFFISRRQVSRIINKKSWKNL